MRISAMHCKMLSQTISGAQPVARSIRNGEGKTFGRGRSDAVDNEIRFKVLDLATPKPSIRLPKFQPSLPAIPEDVDEEKSCVAMDLWPESRSLSKSLEPDSSASFVDDPASWLLPGEALL
ncbi:hypothetical protein FVE85_7013 [Porphyridium purpureum]|uniref:Uncharacterized protein n=1 Tax=Porphyridium purpureum TaxID=35688 RepID=A0A5J4Z8F0_PORPP|nr:hypothetical protein FVE85_7013 [Porphyridium purpureum]|eukprot:POR0850..scf295_1